MVTHVGQKSIDNIVKNRQIYFYLQKLFFMLNQSCLYLFPFVHKSLQLSRHKDAEVFRKTGISIFCLFVVLIFDHQAG